MKYYLVESTIKTTDTDRESRGTVEKHHEFLEKGFDEGRILFSGPKSPVGSGDIMVVRGEGLNEVREFFMHDPVITSRVAEYEYTEFRAVQYRPEVEEWLTGR